MIFYKETDFREGTIIGKVPTDWEIVRIEKVCAFDRGFSYRSDQVTTQPSKIRFITINDFEKEGGLKRNSESLYLKDETDVDPKYFLDEDEVLVANTDMSRGFIIGAPIYIEKAEGKVAYSMDLTRLIFDKKTVNGKFLFYLLKHEKIRNKMKTFAQGTNVLHLNHELMKKLEIPLPPVEEQRAVAGVLGVVDSVIAKTDEVIAKTERLKKGLMQTLLTRGIGHKEFKETEIGKIPKTWDVLRLEDVTKQFISGGTPSTKNPKYWNGDIPWIRSVHLTRYYVDETSIEQFITKEGLENSASNIVPKGNVIIATRVGVGKSAVNLIDVAINQDLTGLIIDKSKIDPFFLVWYLLSPKILSILESFTRGTTIKGIAQNHIKNLLIPLPPIDEQRRIAEILSAVDRKLEFERYEKARLERIKRGLMDLLLTGKIRVKVDCDAVYSG